MPVGTKATPKRPAVVRVDAVVRALKAQQRAALGPDWSKLPHAKQRDLGYYLDGLADAVFIVRRLARPAQRKGKR